MKILNLRFCLGFFTAIDEAELIILGPGSLYTSIIPNLLVPGLSEAIAASTAKKVYVCNVMTQPGGDYWLFSR